MVAAVNEIKGKELRWVNLLSCILQVSLLHQIIQEMKILIAIIADIMEGFGGECSAIEAELDRKYAIRKAIFCAAPGDIVLIAGKGHEKTQHTADGSDTVF